MNSASRLIHGRTLHSAFRLPRNGWTASTRSLGKDKEFLLATWRLVQFLAIDEVSMIPADLLGDAEFRAQQVKNAPHLLWYVHIAQWRLHAVAACCGCQSC